MDIQPLVFVVTFLQNNMLKLLPLLRGGRALAAVLFLATLSFGGNAQAQQVTVPSLVTFSLATGQYTYNYSVMDATVMELAIVNVPASRQSALMNLIAPTGFGISFDPGVGIVSFFQDNNPTTNGSFAANSTVTGFSFTSAFGPGGVTFDALDVSAGLLVAGGFAFRRRLTSQTSVQ